ncbi:Rieske 2Fe-2S domain-containing protein [Aquirufa rosea]|nr:Rieske 2Fe-2S domain-containing protein [Aquirufa rosea]
MMISCQDSITEEPISKEESEYLTRLKDIGTKGYLQEQANVYINMKHDTYYPLSTVNNFVNDQINGILILRKDASTILAFDNCCPHLGSRDQWSYKSSKFTCANHGNSFGINTGQIANCNSNTNFGNLKAYKTTLYKDLLTINFS